MKSTKHIVTLVSLLVATALVATGCSALLDLDELKKGGNDAGVTKEAGADAQLLEAGTDMTPVEASVVDQALVEAAVPDKSVLEAAVPDKAVLEAAVPDKALVEAAVPDQAMVEAAVPDQATPEAAVPDQTVKLDVEPPDQMLPDQMQPDQMQPDQMQPDQMQPDQMVPDQTVVDSSPNWSCAQIMSCAAACVGVPTCIQGCVNNGAPAAKTAYNAFQTCAVTAIAGACASSCTNPLSPGCVACVNTQCSTEYAACQGVTPDATVGLE